MKTYIATVEEGTIRHNLTIKASSRDEALRKISLRYKLINLTEVPG